MLDWDTISRARRSARVPEGAVRVTATETALQESILEPAAEASPGSTGSAGAYRALQASDRTQIKSVIFYIKSLAKF